MNVNVTNLGDAHRTSRVDDKQQTEEGQQSQSSCTHVVVQTRYII